MTMYIQEVTASIMERMVPIVKKAEQFILRYGSAIPRWGIAQAESYLSTDIWRKKIISVAMGITVYFLAPPLKIWLAKTYNEAGTILDQIAIPAKMANFDVVASMKDIKTEVSENFTQSKLVYPNEFFAKAYKIELLEGTESISSFRPLDNQTSLIIPNLKASDYRKNYTINVFS